MKSVDVGQKRIYKKDKSNTRHVMKLMSIYANQPRVKEEEISFQQAMENIIQMNSKNIHHNSKMAKENQKQIVSSDIKKLQDNLTPSDPSTRPLRQRSSNSNMLRSISSNMHSREENFHVPASRIANLPNVYSKSSLETDEYQNKIRRARQKRFLPERILNSYDQSHSFSTSPPSHNPRISKSHSFQKHAQNQQENHQPALPAQSSLNKRRLQRIINTEEIQTPQKSSIPLKELDNSKIELKSQEKSNRLIFEQMKPSLEQEKVQAKDFSSKTVNFGSINHPNNVQLTTNSQKIHDNLRQSTESQLEMLHEETEKQLRIDLEIRMRVPCLFLKIKPRLTDSYDQFYFVFRGKDQKNSRQRTHFFEYDKLFLSEFVFKLKSAPLIPVICLLVQNKGNQPQVIGKILFNIESHQIGQQQEFQTQILPSKKEESNQSIGLAQVILNILTFNSFVRKRKNVNQPEQNLSNKPPNIHYLHHTESVHHTPFKDPNSQTRPSSQTLNTLSNSQIQYRQLLPHSNQLSLLQYSSLQPFRQLRKSQQFSPLRSSVHVQDQQSLGDIQITKDKHNEKTPFRNSCDLTSKSKLSNKIEQVFNNMSSDSKHKPDKLTGISMYSNSLHV